MGSICHRRCGQPAAFGWEASTGRPGGSVRAVRCFPSIIMIAASRRWPGPRIDGCGLPWMQAGPAGLEQAPPRGGVPAASASAPACSRPVSCPRLHPHSPVASAPGDHTRPRTHPDALCSPLGLVGWLMAAASATPPSSLDLPQPGFSKTLLGTKLEDKYLCSACRNVLRRPFQAQCGHRYCSFCLSSILRWAPRRGRGGRPPRLPGATQSAGAAGSQPSAPGAHVPEGLGARAVAGPQEDSAQSPRLCVGPTGAHSPVLAGRPVWWPWERRGRGVGLAAGGLPATRQAHGPLPTQLRAPELCCLRAGGHLRGRRLDPGEQLGE